jgi:choline dehydrogenase
LKVTTGACENPLFKAFIEAGEQAGYPYTDDMNGFQQEGLGPMDMTTYEGKRCSVAKAYLRPALSRPNLELRLGTLVTRIRIDGNRAVGIECVRNGSVEIIDAGEVILCGGAINSPQLLNLSGVGDGGRIYDLGIDVKAELPGVGRNLQDHLEIYIQHSCMQPISIYPATKPFTKLKVGLQWLTTKKGWGASNQFESGGFIRSRAGVEYPDLQYHFLPIAINYDGRSPAGGHGFQAHTGPMRPSSRGSVELRSADPKDPPRILFNYTSTEHDRQVMRDGIRHTREIFAQSAFDDLRGPELAPGPDAESDEALDEFVRQKGESAYHPSCTCKMGTDEMSVVDAGARLHGIEGLRVVDASIMPNIVNGNLNATVIMLAEKLADAIRGREPLPPSEAPVYEAPDWRNRQR